jgi:hypothetical protein
MILRNSGISGKKPAVFYCQPTGSYVPNCFIVRRFSESKTQAIRRAPSFEPGEFESVRARKYYFSWSMSWSFDVLKGVPTIEYPEDSQVLADVSKSREKSKNSMPGREY